MLGVGCVAIDPDYVAPPGPSPAEAEFLALAPLVLRLVSAQRNAEQPAPRLLDVWRENERLRKRVAELETLVEAGARAVDALEGMQIETMLPSAWHALTAEQRLELIGLCCHGCGSLDTGCQCWNDE